MVMFEGPQILTWLAKFIYHGFNKRNNIHWKAYVVSLYLRWEPYNCKDGLCFDGIPTHYFSVYNCIITTNAYNWSPKLDSKYELLIWHDMSRGLSPFLICAQNLAVYICRPGLPGHDCNNEHKRDPGKTPATGMRHYVAGSLSTT